MEAKTEALFIVTFLHNGSQVTMIEIGGCSNAFFQKEIAGGKHANH
jgi:hypothetical protein